MERLTTRNSMGVAVFKESYDCERCGEGLWRLPDYGNGSPTDKLAYYEDLEEQGLLYRLPCKVGDTVYIPKYYLDCEYDYHCPLGYAEGKNMCENGLVCDHEHKKFFISETLFDISMINSIGKTIFLTPEKAEAALEKMKGEEHE